MSWNFTQNIFGESCSEIQLTAINTVLLSRVTDELVCSPMFSFLHYWTVIEQVNVVKTKHLVNWLWFQYCTYSCMHVVMLSCRCNDKPMLGAWTKFYKTTVCSDDKRERRMTDTQTYKLALWYLTFCCSHLVHFKSLVLQGWWQMLVWGNGCSIQAIQCLATWTMCLPH